MRIRTLRPLLVGLLAGIGTGLRRAPRLKNAWPQLAGNFAL